MNSQQTKFRTEEFSCQMNSQTDGFKERMKNATEIFTTDGIRNGRNSEQKNSEVR